MRHRANDFAILVDLVAQAGVAALLPALGDPRSDARVAVRRLTEGSFPRRLFAAVRETDRQRPAIAAVLDALR